jgi:hypothetical protein
MRALPLTLLLLAACVDKDQDSAAPEPVSDADEDGWPTDQDCNDRDASIHPEAPEICDGVDNDCDEAIDEDVKVTVWADADGDGYGDAGDPRQACGPGDGLVDNDLDCDDDNERSHPEAPERCNGRDDDCDGSVDEDPIDGEIYHLDGDRDGYGDPHRTDVACGPRQGLVDDASDCHDDDPTAYPGSTAWEHPEDGVDQDCDGFDGARDLDGDGLCDLFFVSYKDADSYLVQSPVYFGAELGFSEKDTTWLDTQGSIDALAADLDGDGRPELILPSYYDGSSYAQTSWIYAGTPEGPSPDAVTALPTEGVRYVESADLDQDGWPELIFAGYYNGGFDGLTRIYWNQAGRFDAETYTSLDTQGAWELAAEDLDGDGWVDLAFTSYYGPDRYVSHGSVFWNRGGSLDASPPDELPTIGSVSLGVGDFDADGYQDLAMGSFRLEDDFEQPSAVYMGGVSGYDPEVAISLSTHGVRDLETADLDRDGYEDLVVACYRDNESLRTYSYVYWGSPEGLSDQVVTALYTEGTRDVEIADLDLDGWLDLVFPTYYGASGYTAESFIYWGSADGYSDDDLSTLPSTGVFRAAAGDVDHDGWPDLVFNSYYSGSAYETEAVVYYGSEGGFDVSHSAALPVVGAYGDPLLIGAD